MSEHNSNGAEQLFDIERAEEAAAVDVGREVQKQRAREAARQIIAAERERIDDLPDPSRSIREDLLIPIENPVYAIERMAPYGANILLAALRKTGKTVLMLNLAKALVDDEPFLGYPLRPVEGNVVYFNYELTEQMFNRWVKDIGLKNTQKLKVIHRRGKGLPFWLPQVKQKVVSWINRAGGEVALIDPAAKAARGLVRDLNARPQVDEFTFVLDEIKEQTDLVELYMSIHMGWDSGPEDDERSLGSEAWEAWPDAVWYYTRGKGADKGTRFLRAEGRDVDEPTVKLEWDPETRVVRNSQQSRYDHKEERTWLSVCRAVDQLTKEGVRADTETVKLKMSGIDSGARYKAIEKTEADRLIRRNKVGKAKVCELLAGGETLLAKHPEATG